MQNVLQDLFKYYMYSIKDLLENYNISQQELADFIGVPRGRVSGWLTANKHFPPFVADAKNYEIAANTFATLSKEKVHALVKTHRIILGNIEPIEGYKATIATSTVAEPIEHYHKTPTISQKHLVPYYDVDIIAGTRELYDDNPNNTPAYYMDVPEFSGCKAFRVYADNMQPLIDAGSIMFCKPVHNWHDFIEYGQIYAIEVNDNRRFIKYIRRSTNKGNFLMRSHNPEYDDFEVPVSQIKNIWLIEGWMRKKTQ